MITSVYPFATFPSSFIKSNGKKQLEGRCYHLDWCNCTQDQFIYEKLMCVSLSLYNFQNTGIEKGVCYSKLGLEEKSNKVYRDLNKINHIVTYLFGVFVQVYLNKEDSFENYITCEELKTIKEVLKCTGFDLTCVLECLDLCGYTKSCGTC